MASDLIKVAKDVFASERKVKFAYLFGSTALNVRGPLSDLDVAVYVDGRLDSFTYRLQLMELLAKELGTERFDLVMLNKAPIVLKYEVIKNGTVLKEDRPHRVMFETAVLQEYLDSAYMRKIQNEYLKISLKRDAFHG